MKFDLFFFEPLTPGRRFQQSGRCASGFFGSPRRRRVLRRRGLGGGGGVAGVSTPRRLATN